MCVLTLYVYLFTEDSQEESVTPCVDLPPDPPDDSSDVFDDGATSAINVFNLAMDGEDRYIQLTQCFR